ncbi:hypothetical protein M0802_002785 [Mischocyttarus mexicanus]|nr:hypothetical protein M0802_002785 [Mischocyttarus mexicanus]
MWNLNTFIIVATIIGMNILQCLAIASISIAMDEFEENLSLTLGEPMDKCDYSLDTTIKITNYGLTEVQDYFFVDPNITNINLENNSISDLHPNIFTYIPNLYCLNMAGNNLTISLDNILKLFDKKLLTKLNLANAWFHNTKYDPSSRIFRIMNTDTVKKSLSILPNLTHLDISDNNLSALPMNLASMFPNLTHLYLSDNKMQSYFFNRIPSTVKYVYLERNGYDFNIDAIPDGVFGLFFDGNKIYHNVDYKNKYENMTVLSCRNCSNYETFIPSINQIKLLDLDLSSNDIHYIEPGFLNCSKSLERLCLDNNFLDRINFTGPFKNLTHLSLAYNNISYIVTGSFTNQTNLKILNLRGNKIKLVLSDCFSDLEKLEKLDLAENHLTMLPVLWMSNLQNLSYLDLRANQFQNIDNMNIYIHSILNHLFIGNNCFKKMDHETLMKLPSKVVAYVSMGNYSTCRAQ